MKTTDTYQPDARYNVAGMDTLPLRVAAHARRRMYERFIQRTEIRAGEALLDAGVASEQTHEASNYVEDWSVLEHSGHSADQRRLTTELTWVARRAVPLTTPSR